MAKYIDVLAILFWCYGGLQLMIALLLGGIYGVMGLGMGAVGASEGEEEMIVMGGIFVVLAVVLGVILVLQALLPIAAGFGIRKRKNWGRIVGIIAGALGLLSIPFGLALGIFAFVVLLDKEASAEFT